MRHCKGSTTRTAGEARAHSSATSSLRNAHEPVLDAIEHAPLASPADLLREHRTVILVVPTEPGQETRAVTWSEVLNGGPHRGRVTSRLVLVWVSGVLRRAGHRANRCSISGLEPPPDKAK